MLHADFLNAVEASGLKLRPLEDLVGLSRSTLSKAKRGVKGWRQNDGTISPRLEGKAREVIAKLQGVTKTARHVSEPEKDMTPQPQPKKNQTPKPPTPKPSISKTTGDKDGAPPTAVAEPKPVALTPTSYVGLGVNDLLDAVKALSAAEIGVARDHWRRIMRAAIETGVDGDGADAAMIMKAAADILTGGKVRPLQKDWKAEAKAHGVETAASETEKANAEAAAAEKAAQEAAKARADEAAALWPKVKGLATDPRLLDRMSSFVGASGVVGEPAARIAIFLTTVSRLNRRRALCLLRRGAASSGKNFLIDKIVAMLPSSSIITASGGSPRSLPYRGGKDDRDALKHRVVYIPEAAAIAPRNGVENDNTLMLRTLISEGRIVYQTVITRNDAEPITVEIIKDGPIALILTSARDNVEEELLTRLMLADADESPSQTVGVLRSTFGRAGRSKGAAASDTTLQDWQDYQRWLEVSGAPYSVTIPFAEAILAAYGAIPRPLRARRDAENILAAVAASAIAHKAQRKIDGDGKIIAELADYGAAFAGFAGGLSALYSPANTANVRALVRALEELLDEARKTARDALDKWLAEKSGRLEKDAPLEYRPPDTVAATHAMIAKKLGITSADTVAMRLASARAAKLIEICNPDAPRHVARQYRILVSSQEAAGDDNAVVMPAPTAVEEMIGDAGKRAEGLERLAKAAEPVAISSYHRDAQNEHDDHPF